MAIAPCKVHIARDIRTPAVTSDPNFIGTCRPNGFKSATEIKGRVNLRAVVVDRGSGVEVGMGVGGGYASDYGFKKGGLVTMFKEKR